MNTLRLNTSDIPYVDNVSDLATFIEKGSHSHVRVDGKVFVLASRPVAEMVSFDEIEKINSEFGLALGSLRYDPSACEKCDYHTTGYDFIKTAVDIHGTRFLSNEELNGFMLRIDPRPLMIPCPRCDSTIMAGTYVDNHMHNATGTCFAYGCSYDLGTLRDILKTMESGFRHYQIRFCEMKV